MASIQSNSSKAGKLSFRVQLHVNGVRESASFDSKREAKAWALQREAQLSSGSHVSHPQPSFPPPTLCELLQRYKREVSATKRGRRWEEIRLNKLCLHAIASTPLNELCAKHIAQWRDQRLKEVSASTVRREMTLLGHALETSRREWGLINSNPSKDVKKPSDSPHRKQRINNDDLERLMKALNYLPGITPNSKTQEVSAVQKSGADRVLESISLGGKKASSSVSKWFNER